MRRVFVFLTLVVFLAAFAAASEKVAADLTADLVAYQAALGQLQEIRRQIDARKGEITPSEYSTDPTLFRLKTEEIAQKKKVELLETSAIKRAKKELEHEAKREVKTSGGWRRAEPSDVAVPPPMPEQVRLHQLRVENERLRDEIEKTREEARRRADKYERRVYDKEKREREYARKVREAYYKAGVTKCPMDVIWVSPSIVERAWGFNEIKITTFNKSGEPVSIRDNMTGQIVVKCLCPGASMVISKVYPWKNLESGTVPVSFTAYSEVTGRSWTSTFNSQMYPQTWQRVQAQEWYINANQY